MIYSFYGRLSISNNNVDELRAGNIPPTFYTYGTEDPFYRQFNQNVEAVRQTGVLVESHVLEGWPHSQQPLVDRTYCSGYIFLCSHFFLLSCSSKSLMRLVSSSTEGSWS